MALRRVGNIAIQRALVVSRVAETIPCPAGGTNKQVSLSNTAFDLLVPLALYHMIG